MNQTTQNSPVKTAIEIAINLLLVGLILVWCFRIVQPFISVIVWAAVIAISMWKPFLKLQSMFGGNKKLALALFTILGLAIVIVPSWMFVGSIAGSATEITQALESGEFEIAPPNESVQDWPLVGKKVYTQWSAAATNFEAWLTDNAETVKALLGGIAKSAAGVGVGALQFLISVLISAAFLANAELLVKGLRVLFARLMGDTADSMMKLSSSTITSVAVGVLGISFIQATLAGIGMMAVGVPAAGVLALLVLIFCIAQLPPWLILFPVIGYVFSVESTTVASIFAVWAVIVSFLDMVLKPIMLGRGVEAPMLVILLGAIGGMLMSGIVGLFVGAVVLALGYKLMVAWLVMYDDDDDGAGEEAAEPQA